MACREYYFWAGQKCRANILARTYGADAVATECIHHLLRVLVEEYFANVDCQQVVVALFQSNLDGLAKSLAEAHTLAAQLGNVQENRILTNHLQKTINICLSGS